MRSTLRIWIPTNRAYHSKKNWGKPAPMDGWNELRNSDRTHRQAGADREREDVLWCARFIRSAMNLVGYEPMTEDDRQQCAVTIEVVEPHDRRDVPNVLGGVSKYVCDALTARNRHGVGAIWDDNSKWMPCFNLSVSVDPQSPGVGVTVIPIRGTGDADGKSQA